MDLTDAYRAFYPIITQYTFFSAAHGTYSPELIFFGEEWGEQG
jgi:hypothetical protein